MFIANECQGGTAAPPNFDHGAIAELYSTHDTSVEISKRRTYACHVVCSPCVQKPISCSLTITIVIHDHLFLSEMHLLCCSIRSRFPGKQHAHHLGHEQSRLLLGLCQVHLHLTLVLVFLNDITRNIISSNDAEILLVYYGYRVHPQAHGYTIVAFHPRVFQGYRIYFIP
ncbi:Os11g0269700 [Oryza sativa Japonica Group]|uniref:Os11g0269700 protein n=2 Tax=Oryza sativa subsp. japonica TaxID=39947 RepID=C7J905_ORYSJ|nr:hypothetical protein EE612_054685 [Oryza sativa]BAH95203.1 Os11g0269700 [Oryza sativa Japonica Group]BAT13553.1 Os11g0269700 [Oryza sativa Japonica Group]|eukprot:NP_001176475.1 Os11g0269700 [Oryza sativa Japonica Group]